MNAQETEIYEFLKKFPNLFVSVNEISKSVGSRKKFNEDRTWTRPILRRMEMDGVLESNPFGEYRLKRRPDDTTTFKRALSMPGFPLGDTAIVALDEEAERLKDASATFKRALSMPGFPLGNTAIIVLEEEAERLKDAPTTPEELTDLQP